MHTTQNTNYPGSHPQRLGARASSVAVRVPGFGYAGLQEKDVFCDEEWYKMVVTTGWISLYWSIYFI